MVVHTCPRCSYSTTNASHFRYHILRKTPCNNTSGFDKSRTEIWQNFRQEIEHRGLTCNLCGTVFTSRASKCRHKKNCSGQVAQNVCVPDVPDTIVDPPVRTARRGYIYIITCDALARDSMYKIGRTVCKNECIEEAKKNLVKRYATYWIDPRVIAVAAVSDADKAETHVITQSLQSKRQVSDGHLREIIQGNLELEIMPAFENAAATYAVS